MQIMKIYFSFLNVISEFARNSRAILIMLIVGILITEKNVMVKEKSGQLSIKNKITVKNKSLLIILD